MEILDNVLFVAFITTLVFVLILAIISLITYVECSINHYRKFNNIRKLLLIVMLFISSATYAHDIEQVETVKAKSTDYYTIYVKGYTEIIVNGNGSTDLDLYVFNNIGKLVEESSDCTDKCKVTLNPKSEKRYVIKVVNRGKTDNTYTLTIN